ncbi:MAG: NDP-sugar synthase [Polyangiales bacterium]
MQAMLFAAGLGSRLRPLTDRNPKPALLVGDRPLVAYAIDVLKRGGVTHIVANTHHLPDKMSAVLRAHCPASIRLDISHEPILLGTAGGLRRAWDRYFDRERPVLVYNGDILFEPDLRALMLSHERENHFATMTLRISESASMYGEVRARDGNVISILGEPETKSGESTVTMFTGVHLLSASAMQTLPERGCVVRDGYMKWLRVGRPVGAHVVDAPFEDLGTLDRYFRANMDTASEQSQIAPSATIGQGTTITECVIGERALIGPDLTLRRAVVLPDANVQKSLENAIVSDSAIVQIP